MDVFDAEVAGPAVSAKARGAFRNYAEARPSVYELYREQRTKQCHCYVRRMLAKYCPTSEPGPDKAAVLHMSMWQALQHLNQLVDRSDPDVTVPNLVHAFQTAEGLRAAGESETLQLCGLLHDAGKVLFLKGCKEDGTSVDTQWGVVGDTFPVGVPRSATLEYPELNAELQCACESRTESTYPMGCGLSGVDFCFGHDEYLYRVLRWNHQRPGCALTIRAPDLMYCVRFHSFYAWHKNGGYAELASEEDMERRPLLQKFSSFDLYTKSDVDMPGADELKPYYNTLMARHLGCSLDEVLEW